MADLKMDTLYFTMKEIKGESLSHYVHLVHSISDEQGWGSSSDGWSLHRLISVLYDVSKAMVYAHEHGVLHRDLKTDNVMIGALGESLVVDWGLATLIESTTSSKHGDTIAVTSKSKEGEGTLCGTPRYLAPELARRTRVKASSSTEVYALGVMLYEILVGVAPYNTLRLSQLLKVISEEGLPDIPSRNDDEQNSDYVSHRGALLPMDLVMICHRAIAFDPAQRYTDVLGFTQDVGAWLDGSQRRRQALIIVKEADVLNDRIDQAQKEAQVLRSNVKNQAKLIEAWQMNEAKKALWSIEDEATQLEQEASLLSAQQVQLYRSALAQKSDLTEAHQALALYYQKQHRLAEQTGNLNQIQSAELALKEHLQALPMKSIEKRNLKEYLSGQAAYSLSSEPVLARAHLARFELHHRYLSLGESQDLGTLPLKKHRLDIGSYMLTLEAEGYHPCKYPIYNQRNDHYDGLDPDGLPFAIKLLPLGTLGDNDCYVAGGWCRLGEIRIRPIACRAKKSGLMAL